MKLVEHKFTLDVNQTASQVNISVKKGDTARRLLIHLTESGYPCHLSKDCYAVFSANKPDCHVIFNNCTIEDCVIGYDFTAQTVAAVGLVNCEIIVYGARGVQLTSASFDIIVEESTYAAVESSDEANALASLIQEIKALKMLGLRAPAIIGQTEGETISLTDASNEALQGLRIFGKSIQDGGPTPDNPVEIENVGAFGGITSSVAGQNLLDAYAITAPNTNTAIQITNNGKIIKFYATGVTATYARAELAMNHLIGRKFYVGFDKKLNYGNNVDGYLQIRYSLDGALKYIENVPLLAGASEIPAEAYDVRLVIYFKNASVAIEAGSYVQYEGLRISLAAGSAWEPYQKIQQITVSTPGVLPGIPVTSSGNYIDSNGQQWICDEIDLGRGVYIQRIKTVQLPSAANYYRETSWNNKAAFMVANLLADAVAAIGYDTVANLLSTHFGVSSPGSITYNAVNAIGQGGTNGGDIFFSVKGITNAEALQDWVANNAPAVNYILATPIETALTEEDKAAFAALYTYKPSTFIYNDAGAYMAAEYVADTKTYIDNRGGSTTVIGDAGIVKATVE